MEYVLGSLITLVSIWFVRHFLKPLAQLPKLSIRYTQSSSYEKIKEVAPIVRIFKKPKPSQSTLYEKKQSTRVIIVNGTAYWIADNVLFKAGIVNGIIDKDSAEKVDTMAMNDVQLDETIFIVNKLTEGLEDDRGNSRNKKL
jgi:hypothetical protein